MQENFDALNTKLNIAKAKVVALHLDVKVIQLTLSSTKSALENRNEDLVGC